eukprot:1215256-Rhodomonas_salina.1
MTKEPERQHVRITWTQSPCSTSRSPGASQALRMVPCSLPPPARYQPKLVKPCISWVTLHATLPATRSTQLPATFRTTPSDHSTDLEVTCADAEVEPPVRFELHDLLQAPSHVSFDHITDAPDY